MDTSYAVLSAFLLTCLIIEATPGPNMTYLAILSLGKGRRAGYAAVAGVAIGLLIIGLAVALGAAPLLANSASIHETLRWAGFLYLLWLAWDAWRLPLSGNASDKIKNNGDFTYFRRGLMTNILNPKAAIFYIAILPGFTDPLQNLTHQTLMMTFIYVAVATTVHTLIVTMAGLYRLNSETLSQPKVRLFFATALVVTALWFLQSTQR